MQKQRFRLRNNFILNILFSFSSFVLALFGFLAVLPPASEPEASAIIDGEQFALTVTNSEAINLEINPTDSGAIAIAKDTIVANTNSPAGYKLYVSTDSETSNNIHLNGRESNDTEDKKIIAASGTFNAPAALNQNESSWGFALAGVNGFDSSYDIANPSPSAKFAAVPEKNNEQLIHDHEGRATDDETEIYFAAKANTNISSGNYKTTILYTTLSEATDQDTTEINLDKTVFATNYEETNNKTVTVETSIIVSQTPNLKLWLGNFEPTNVVITSIAPLSFTFDLPSNIGAGTYDLQITLVNLARGYSKPAALKIYNSMQEMTPEFCESMTLEEQKQFIDLRDNKIYWVAKLKDGNCWMTQNLDYDLSVQANQTLTPATSNVTENRTVVPANTDLATFEIDINAIYYLDGGDTYYANGTTRTEGYSTLPANDTNRHYAQGDYYSWKAATAGQGTTDITTEQDINESICPAGWRLATDVPASARYSYGALIEQYPFTNQTADATFRDMPLFFTHSGYIYAGSLEAQNYGGYYWTSKAYEARADLAFRFYIDDTNVYASLDSNRAAGMVIRCVAKGTPQTLVIKDSITEEVISSTDFEISIKIPEAPAKEGYNFLGYAEDKTATEPTYNVGDTITEEKTLYAIYEKIYPLMQDVSSWKNTLTLEQQIQVKDTRDGKIYWVSKLKDGNIWMTQNLDYDLSVQENQTLTPATSNVTANRTVVPANTDLATFSIDRNAIYYLDGGDVYCANGTTKTKGLSTLPEDDTNRHYAQGDYYSWKAATAGQGTTNITTEQDVNESICPAGWHLPTNNSVDANYSFGNLVKQYGYTGANQYDTTDATLLASPLFFARGGLVNSGSLSNQGSYGSYWSSRASSSSDGAYVLRFGSSYVYPSSYYGRYGGFSVRCVAL